ncbi:putative DNA-binding protein (MmcQ/YjbR family) [Brevibacterium sanguinis]|uniref:DNA-binding protein (MmcQ/YjbR family) n=2 Tax=Brevibacterium TaxID=1696 RepID=A0ABX9GPS5_9MICO|nr:MULTISPECIES: MmcQ/YjbR family DNA-binding protein [Brevibacterium]RBP62563.1 putative DNA-binding protein (MmcQ/YjbR family) [Brevibacterium sanguinis]RBP69227.1 putative DNA-binding protein (MmcQ/YjbR family) [Brevibacterium celere]
MEPETVLDLAHDQAMQYPGVDIEHPFGPEYRVYKVRGKMFMMHFELRGTPCMNLKIDPLDGEVLRDAYSEITPGYHMNKRHWITVTGAGESGGAGSRLDDELVHDLVLESYCLVVAKLPIKDRPVDPTTFGR